MSGTRAAGNGEQSSPDSDPATGSPDELASPPGWAAIPDPLPGPASPDPQNIPGRDGTGGGSGTTPAPILTASFKGKAAAYGAIAKTLFIALGGLANQALAASEDDEAFIPDADDLATVPPPVGRLAARRIPLGDGSENFTDLADIGQAAVGIAAWVGKGIASTLQARRERRRRAARGAAVYDPGPDTDSDRSATESEPAGPGAGPWGVMR